jgi:hypothetical protein
MTELSSEHRALLEEAQALQIDVPEHLAAAGADLNLLRDMIGRQTTALAREAVAKRRLEQADEDADLATKGAFDEVMGETRGVLVRVTEWTEWIPVSKSPHLTQLSLANGVTGFEAGEKERLLTVEGIGTQRVKTVELEDGATLVYMLYAFKATLAQNVHTTMVTTLVEAQGSNMEGEEQRPQQQTSKIITPDDTPPGPNRHQRRHPRA